MRLHFGFPPSWGSLQSGPPFGVDPVRDLRFLPVQVLSGNCFRSGSLSRLGRLIRPGISPSRWSFQVRDCRSRWIAPFQEIHPTRQKPPVGRLSPFRDRFPGRDSGPPVDCSSGGPMSRVENRSCPGDRLFPGSVSRFGFPAPSGIAPLKAVIPGWESVPFGRRSTFRFRPLCRDFDPAGDCS